MKSRLYLAEQILQAVRDGHHTIREIVAVLYRVSPDHLAYDGYAKKIAVAARKLAEGGRLTAEKRARFEKVRSRGTRGITTAQRVFWHYSLC